MGKKILSIIILFIISLSLAACMIYIDPQSTTSSESFTETSIETFYTSEKIPNKDDEKGFVFMYEDHEIYMGMPEEEVQQFKNDYSIINYVMKDGHRYEFDHFYLDCVPDGGELAVGPSLVEMLFFKDNSCETAEGVHIGDSLEKVVDTYKKEEVELITDDYYQYRKCDSILSFSFKDNLVTEIKYFYLPQNNDSRNSNEANEKGFVFMYEGHEIYMGMPEEKIKLIDGYTNPGLAQDEVLMIRYEFDSFYVDCSKWFLSKDHFIYFTDNTVETMEGI